MSARGLDEVLPTYDWREAHGIELACAPAEALAAFLATPVAPDGVVSMLFRLRGLGRKPAIGQALEQMGFAVLVRTDTEVVAGAAGTPWRPRSGLRSFAEARPGSVRIAMDVRAAALDGGCRLSTETRIAATDEAARRAFRRYWLVVRPFSGLIRRRWLSATRRAIAAANRSHDPGP